MLAIFLFTIVGVSNTFTKQSSRHRRANVGLETMGDVRPVQVMEFVLFVGVDTVDINENADSKIICDNYF